MGISRIFSGINGENAGEERLSWEYAEFPWLCRACRKWRGQQNQGTDQHTGGLDQRRRAMEWVCPAQAGRDGVCDRTGNWRVRSRSSFRAKAPHVAFLYGITSWGHVMPARSQRRLGAEVCGRLGRVFPRVLLPSNLSLSSGPNSAIRVLLSNSRTSLRSP